MPANGDSLLTPTWYDTVGHVKKVVLDVLFDSGDGSFTSVALAQKIDGFLLKLVTDPGATAPTDNYDITITDAEGFDLLQGLAANRHTTTSQNIEIVMLATGNHPAVSATDTLTLNISGNATISATTQIILYWTL